MSSLLKYLLQDWYVLEACMDYAKVSRALFAYVPSLLWVDDQGLSANVDDALKAPSSRVSLSDLFFSTFHFVVPIMSLDMRALIWSSSLSPEQLEVCALHSY